MTLRADIKAILDPLLGERVYKDRAPARVQVPYAVVTDSDPTSAALKGDRAVIAWRHDGTVDLWQAWNTDDETLVLQVIAALDGARISSGMHLAVQGSARTPEVDASLTHHTIFLGTSRLR